MNCYAEPNEIDLIPRNLVQKHEGFESITPNIRRTKTNEDIIKNIYNRHKNIHLNHYNPRKFDFLFIYAGLRYFVHPPFKQHVIDISFTSYYVKFHFKEGCHSVTTQEKKIFPRFWLYINGA